MMVKTAAWINRQQLSISVILLWLAVISCSQLFSSQASTAGNDESEAKEAQDVKEIFKRCTPCHGEDGRGRKENAPNAPNFTDPLWHLMHSDDEMINSISEGIEHMMSRYKDELSADEIRSLVGFIRNFSEVKIEVAQADVAISVFQQNCQQCHNEDGKGKKELFPNIPDFTNKTWLDSKSDEQLCTSIINGIKNGRSIMPGWKGKIAPGEIKGLVAVLRTFPNKK